MDRSLMCSPSASAARAPNSTARRFKTGSAPGKPRHTGHVFTFGSSPKRVEHPQKIFDSVLSWAWTSSPMMVSQLLVSGFMFQVSSSVDSINWKPETRNLKPSLRLQPLLRHARVAGFILQLLPARLKGRALCQEVIQMLRQAGALFRIDLRAGIVRIAVGISIDIRIAE